MTHLIFFLSSHQPTTVKKVPWCFYPKDHGYNVNTTNFVETDTGFTLDIVRNAKNNQSSAPVGSPDINTLRVQVFYSSATMLRFKVGAPLFILCLTSQINDKTKSQNENGMNLLCSHFLSRSGTRTTLGSRSRCR